MKMTLESFEWDVILHLERHLKKLRQKGEMVSPHFFSANALNGSQLTSQQKWVLLGIQTLFVIWERDDDDEKTTENAGELCIFEGEMLPISSAVRTHCAHQLEVEICVLHRVLHQVRTMKNFSRENPAGISVEWHHYPTHHAWEIQITPRNERGKGSVFCK